MRALLKRAITKRNLCIFPLFLILVENRQNAKSGLRILKKLLCLLSKAALSIRLLLDEPLIFLVIRFPI